MCSGGADLGAVRTPLLFLCCKMGASGETGITLIVRLGKAQGGAHESEGGVQSGTGGAAQSTSGAVAGSLPHWVQCDACTKWRKLPPGVSPKALPDSWRCADNTWSTPQASCSFPEEHYKVARAPEPPFRLLRSMDAGRCVLFPPPHTHGASVAYILRAWCCF